MLPNFLFSSYQKDLMLYNNRVIYNIRNIRKKITAISTMLVCVHFFEGLPIVAIRARRTRYFNVTGRLQLIYPYR